MLRCCSPVGRSSLPQYSSTTDELVRFVFTSHPLPYLRLPEPLLMLLRGSGARSIINRMPRAARLNTHPASQKGEGKRRSSVPISVFVFPSGILRRRSNWMFCVLGNFVQIEESSYNADFDEFISRFNCTRSALINWRRSPTPHCHVVSSCSSRFVRNEDVVSSSRCLI